MGGFILVSTIFALAIFFVYPSGEFESMSQRIIRAAWIGGLMGLVGFSLSQCGFGNGETEIYYRR